MVPALNNTFTIEGARSHDLTDSEIRSRLQFFTNGASNLGNAGKLITLLLELTEVFTHYEGYFSYPEVFRLDLQRYFVSNQSLLLPRKDH